MVKYIIYISLGIFIISCQANNLKSSHSSKVEDNIQECSVNPTIILKLENLKEIQLKNQSVTESGILREGETVGFAWEAQAGDIIKYQTEDNICIWLYAPDNNIIKTTELPITGKYIMQISIPEGLQTFEISLELNSPNTAKLPQNNSPSNSDNLSNNSDNQIEKKPNVEEFIRDYYLELGNRNYAKTWEQLSSQFKTKAKSYQEYQEWWNSVQKINIENISTLSINDKKAVVYAELSYVLIDETTYTDPKNKIYLVWEDTKHTWLINNKK
jgi:hypothetical protein